MVHTKRASLPWTERRSVWSQRLKLNTVDKPDSTSRTWIYQFFAFFTCISTAFGAHFYISMTRPTTSTAPYFTLDRAINRSFGKCSARAARFPTHDHNFIRLGSGTFIRHINPWWRHPSDEKYVGISRCVFFIFAEWFLIKSWCDVDDSHCRMIGGNIRFDCFDCIHFFIVTKFKFKATACRRLKSEREDWNRPHILCMRLPISCIRHMSRDRIRDTISYLQYSTYHNDNNV